MLKETSTQRLSGRRRKIVVKKTEMMYVPLLETIQSQLQDVLTLQDVCFQIHYQL